LASVLATAPSGVERASSLLEEAVEQLSSPAPHPPSTPQTGERDNRARELLLATSLVSLGLLRKRQGRLEDALPLYERAANLRESHLGRFHPDAIACQHNLAELARAAGDEERALSLQQDILRRIESL
ncbi:MAG: hypothetical protein SGPRY_013586, partial [Prymnesium sp.]